MPTDREEVIAQVDALFPKVTPFGAEFENYHALREIMLGGSKPWSNFHKHFPKYEGKRILDIGANEGVFTLFAALKGAKEAVAVEASTALVAKMIQRCKYLPNVYIVNAAVWKDRGHLPFLSHATQDPDALRCNGSLESDGIKWTDVDRESAPKVACLTLADVLGDREWDCVKMDIEGAEAEVLLATPQYALKQIKFMFLELHHWTSEALYTELFEHLLWTYRIQTAWTSPAGRIEVAYLWRKDQPQE